MRISSRLFVLCSCVLHAQLILVQHKKQKREKDCETRKEQNFLRCFFLLPPKKRKKYGHRKCRPKDKQATKGQDGHISNLSLSLSLSFVSCMHLSTVLLPGRKKDTESPVRRRRRESSLLRQVSLSLRSRDGVVVSSESERTKKASIRPKEEKQTNKGRVKQKISKSANVAFFSEQERQRF